MTRRSASAVEPPTINTPACSPRTPGSAAFWFRLMLLAFAVTALRLAYLAWVCPYTLAEDEAHYWEWSRRLDWSYYSKGPGIAWLIAASTALFSRLGVELSEFVVRAPAAISGGVLMVAVGGLARDITTSNRAGIIAALAVLMLPILQAPAMLMTIDMPYFACWGIAAWSGYRALRVRCRPAWLVLGAAIGIGFLFKYTILLLVPGLVLFALFQRDQLRLAPSWRWWLAGGTSLAALGLAPVIIYNARHDWPTARHLLGHLGLPGGDSASSAAGGRPFDPLWIPEFIGGQMLAVGPLIILMVIAASLAWKQRRSPASPGRLYLLACAAPIFLFYLGVMFFTRPEGNWPAAGYITMLPLVAWLLVPPASNDQEIAAARSPLFHRIIWYSGAAVALALAIITLRLDLVAESTPVVRLTEWSQRNGLIDNDRSILPIGRITGADLLAADVQHLAGLLERETDLEPFIIGHHYGRASQLAFYLPGHPTTYCTSALVGGGRRTQYDLWPETNLHDLERLAGRPAVIVGGKPHYWTPVFDRIVERGELAGESRGRITFLGYGYRGFAGTERIAEVIP